VCIHKGCGIARSLLCAKGGGEPHGPLFSQPSYPNPQNVTQTPQLSPQQQQLQNTAAQFLTSQIGQPAQAYPGSFTAGLTPDQQAQIAAMGQGAAAAGPAQQAGLAGLTAGSAAGIPTATTGMGALAAGAAGSLPAGFTGMGALGNYAAGNYVPGAGGAGDAFLNAVLGGTARAAQQQFAGSIPAIRGPFVAAGQTGFSSPEEAALGGAAAQFATGLQSNLANQALAQYNQAQQNQLQAAGAAAGLPLSYGQAAAQAGTAPWEAAARLPTGIQEAALTAAGMPQQVQQQQLTAQYQDWLRQLGGAWQAAGVPAFSTLAAQTGFQNQYPNVYGQSPFQSLFSGLTGLAGPAAMYFGSPYRR
jgi:hypothetical protein